MTTRFRIQPSQLKEGVFFGRESLEMVVMLECSWSSWLQQVPLTGLAWTLVSLGCSQSLLSAVAVSCGSSWSGPCRTPPRSAAPTPGRRTRRGPPPQPSWPSAPSPSSAGGGTNTVNEWRLAIHQVCGSNLCLCHGPFLFLLLPLGHVLVVLLGLCESCDEGVEDPKEHIWFQLRLVFSKVLQRLDKLDRRRDVKLSAVWPLMNLVDPRFLLFFLNVTKMFLLH